jgi:glycosyltransferase involved in cell wall biosynthesis
MSVYNGEAFLRESIESMLAQTFTNFEFIIINDGSTDKTQEILESYNDSRILLIPQDNMGLTLSLNKGVDLSRGEYLARMDSDDISHPQRLEQQIKWLKAHPQYCAVASKVSCIDENGKKTSDWASDQSTITAEEMRMKLPRINCIAHPSIMFRSDVIKTYLYNPLQPHSQDYDLYLRLFSDGLKIGKINDTLLTLRLHSESVTHTTVINSAGFKNIPVKKIYLKSRIFRDKKFTWFDFIIFTRLIQEMIFFYKNTLFLKKNNL